MIRSIAAVLAGLLAAGAIITAVEAVRYLIYPTPAGVDLSSPEELAAVVEELPAGALVFLLVAYLCGALTGGAVTAKVAGRSAMPKVWFVGGVLATFALLSALSLSHPLWMTVLGVAVHPPGVWLGARLALR